MEDTLAKYLLMLRTFLMWGAVSLLILGGDQLGWLEGVKAPLGRGLNQLNRTIDKGVAIVKAPGETVAYWYDGSQRIARLEQRLGQMVVDKSRYEMVVNENKQLRQMLQEENGVEEAVKVIAWLIPGEEASMIDKGERAGVESGMVVIDRQGVVVGRVVEVGRFSSRVERLVDNGVKVGVRVMGKVTTGVIVGTGGQVQLQEVLQSEDLVGGDVVVTSGADGLYPRGLVVGEVEELTGKRADVTKGGVVKLYAKKEGVVVVTDGSSREIVIEGEEL